MTHIKSTNNTGNPIQKTTLKTAYTFPIPELLTEQNPYEISEDLTTKEQIQPTQSAFHQTRALQN